MTPAIEKVGLQSAGLVGTEVLSISFPAFVRLSGLRSWCASSRSAPRAGWHWDEGPKVHRRAGPGRDEALRPEEPARGPPGRRVEHCCSAAGENHLQGARVGRLGEHVVGLHELVEAEVVGDEP